MRLWLSNHNILISRDLGETKRNGTAEPRKNEEKRRNKPGGYLMSDRFINMATAARRLGVTKNTVYKYLEAGKIPFSRFGLRHGYRIKEKDFLEFMNRRKQCKMNLY